eukprot:4064774-Ditylum_brightwellii.AAC.1
MTNLWSADDDLSESANSGEDVFDGLMCAPNNHCHGRNDNVFDEKVIIHQLVSLRSPQSVIMFDDINVPEDKRSKDNVDPENKVLFNEFGKTISRENENATGTSSKTTFRALTNAKQSAPDCNSSPAQNNAEEKCHKECNAKCQSSSSSYLRRMRVSRDNAWR